mgnify:CR=1 FL=1
MPCSFCKSADHWTRDRQGKVVCPKLLSTECKYCHEKGHTIRHCPILKERKSNRNNFRRQERRDEVDNDGFHTIRRKNRNNNSKKIKNTPVAKVNKFQVFNDIEQEEERKEEKLNKEWPSLTNSSLTETSTWNVSESCIKDTISLYERVSKIPLSNNEELSKWDEMWPEHDDVPSNLMEWRRINRFTKLGKNTEIKKLTEKLENLQLKPLTVSTAWSDYESESDDIRSEISELSNDLASEWCDSEKSYCDPYENVRYPTIGEYDPVMNDYYM